MPESSLVSKGPCPNPVCGSSDACATYDDGHAHCFSCGKTYPDGVDGEAVSSAPKKPKLSEGLIEDVAFRDLTKRGLDEATCRRYGYGIAEVRGRSCQVAPYCSPSTGEVVAQKCRTPDKDFFVLGDLKKAGLFGQHLYRTGGKMLVITEGEIDCLSVAQAMALKWAVVSVPNGANGAVKSIKANLEWVSSYDSVILWFDNDEPGREAAHAVAPLLPPGKVKIVTTPGGYKDANDVLRELGAAEVARAVWDAPTWRPDGIVSGADIKLEDLMSGGSPGWQTPYPFLNEMTRGMHETEVWLLTAGSGIGKSTDAREFLYKAICDGLRVGAVFLEESKETTATAMIALDNNVLLADLRDDPKTLSEEQWRTSYHKLIANGRYHAYDHFGSVESDNLMSKLEYLAVSCECDLIVLDHISIAVSGLDMDADERRIIDVLMTKLRSLSQRTGVRILVISHLRKVGNGNQSFEQGGQISLDDLRGSGSLKQLADCVIARERDQQAESEDERDIALIRVLKCRYTGRTGPADKVRYNRNTGRVKPVDAFEEAADDTAPDSDY